MAVKIGLDAGHGGTSTGTYSCSTKQDGLYEKDYTLELAKMVGERLKANGFEPFYTRTADINPGNVSARAKMCANAGCKYAVSIHFNGFANAAAKGCEVFVPYAETAAGIETGYYNYLGKFFTRRAPFARSSNYNNRNETFDKRLNTAMRKFDASTAAKKDYFGFIRTGWELELSADLLEVCFLTNAEDFKTYTEHKAEIADAIARSIVEGFKKTYKAGASGGAGSTSGGGTNSGAGSAPPAAPKGTFRVVAGSFSSKANAAAHVKALKAAGFDAYIQGV